MNPLEFALLADENIAPDVVAALREHLVDVRTLATEFALCPPWLGAWSANILIAAFVVAVGARRLRRTEAPAAA